MAGATAQVCPVGGTVSDRRSVAVLDVERRQLLHLELPSSENGWLSTRHNKGTA